MATARQVEANRRNAARSTGPRTPEGKSHSRENAAIHGCAAREIHSFSWEDPEEYASLLTGLTDSWKPVNAQEHHQVSLIADAAIRIRRAEELELALIESLAATLDARRRDEGVNSLGPRLSAAVAIGEDKNAGALDNVNRYVTRAHANYNRYCDSLRGMQKDRQTALLREFRLQEAQARYDSHTIADGKFPDADLKLASFGPQGNKTTEPADVAKRTEELTGWPERNPKPTPAGMVADPPKSIFSQYKRR